MDLLTEYIFLYSWHRSIKEVMPTEENSFKVQHDNSGPESFLMEQTGNKPSDICDLVNI